MKHPSCWIVGLVVCLTPVAGPLFAQAPLDILTSGSFADKTVLMDTAWFRVPTTTGYSYAVLLDAKPVPADLTNVVNQVDYHELAVWRTNVSTLAVSNRLLRFIIVSSQRSKDTSYPPETGLIVWTPYPPINSTAAEFAGAHLHITAPLDYPKNLDIPIVARVDDDLGNERRANGMVTAPGFESQAFRVRRGWGFGYVNPATSAGAIAYDAQLTSLQDSKQINIEAATAWQTPGATLSGNVTWPENSRIFLTGNLAIPAGASLTVGAGTVVKINPYVNITNSGRLVLNGTPDRPVVFTATNRVAVLKFGVAWGGFLLRGSSASLVAQNAIINGAGGASSFDFTPGASHKSQQATLLIHSGAKAYLTNCYLLSQAGQVANVYASDTIYDHCLFQRGVTSGEYSGGGTHIINHSAIIEFPEELGFVDRTIADDDYDTIYFTEGTNFLMNSLFGFSKDDCIDSGSGGKGTVLVTNCWCESTLHECLAWSGGERVTRAYDTVSFNSGQGIECGWSTGDNSPLCYAERLLSLGNSVGARIGDNYNWSYNGQLYVSNSLVLYNYRDTFLKTWNPVGSSGWNTNAWVDRLQQAHFTSNFFTAADPRFPTCQAWDPAADGWRLAHWMTSPADAPVGIGLAVWTNLLPMTAMFNGVPVRLSCFTTNFVTVDYRFANNTTLLADGTLTFAPGETLKLAYPAGFDLSSNSQVECFLSNPLNGELTSITNVTFQGVVPAPQISLGVRTNLLPGYRLPEGLFVLLSSPAAQPVSLDYAWDAAGVPLASGIFTLNPLETSLRVFPAGFSPYAYPSVRLSVSSPAGAPLTGITSVTFTNPPLTVGFGGTATQLSLDTLGAGLPVNLSAPAGTVTVDYQIEGSGQVLTNGALAFAPGQSALALTAPSLDLENFDLLRVTLSHPVGAQLGAVSTAYLVRTLTAPPLANATFTAKGADWRYLDTGANLGTPWSVSNPSGWTGFAFSENAWPHGPAPLGYNNTPAEATTLGWGSSSTSKILTYYFRHVFRITNAASYSTLTFNLLRDDGAVVYLNGPEVYRENIANGVVTTNTTSITNVGNTATTYYARTIATNLLAQGLREGTNLLAVEIHQNNGGSADIILDLELIGIPTPLPPPPQHLYLGAFDPGQLTLAWGDPAFALQQSAQVTGPWTNVVWRSPAFLAPVTNGQVFFRLHK